MWGRGILGALAGGAILLLALVGAASWIAAVNAKALASIAHVRAAEMLIEKVAGATRDAESGQRGYLLTGSDAYLDPYNRAAPDISARLDQLAAAFSGNSDSDRLAASLRQDVLAKFAELGRTVALAREGKRDAALSIVDTGEGRASMESITRAADELTARQDARWGQLAEAIQWRGRLLILLDAAGVLLAALLGWVAVRIFQGNLRALRAAESGIMAAYAVVQQTNAGLEAEVARRTADWRTANEEVQRFAYIVSHDLRAPLVNIMGFTGELEATVRTLRRHTAVLATTDGALPADLEEAVEQDLPEAIRFIRTSADKMDRLIGAILRLSREGRRLLQPERIAMRDLVGNALDALAHQMQEAGAEAEIGPLPDLVSDRLAVEQVFTNLLDNALKYRDPNRPLRLIVRGRREFGREGGMCVFEVEDTGRGIADRDRERVFELFRRAGGQDVPGEGVGLAHVRALVRRLGGRIELDSAPGQGSTFRLHFPAELTPNLEPIR